MTAKKLSIILLSCAVVFSIVAIVISFSMDKTPTVQNSTASVQYVLKDYNGHLAVFYNKEAAPYKEFDIMTASFDDYDRELLIAGIKADSEEKLRKLIEDYTS